MWGDGQINGRGKGDTNLKGKEDWNNGYKGIVLTGRRRRKEGGDE
jgi:hypothetical protein